MSDFFGWYLDNSCIDAEIHKPWIEDSNDFPESLWDSSLPTGESWGVQMWL